MNLNAGYNISLAEGFNLIPYAGIGLFYENIDGYVSSDGGGSYTNNYPGYNVSIDDNIVAPLANIDLLVEYYLSGHFLITGEIKGQIDIYDGTYNSFPNLTLGIGYRF